MARSNQLSKREPVLGALERGKRRTSVPAIASALTDLGEIDKFVKEQAEAIPFGRGSGIVSVIKAGGDAFDQMLSSGMRSFGKANATGRR
jgi:uncharacterized membrane protein